MQQEAVSTHSYQVLLELPAPRTCDPPVKLSIIDTSFTKSSARASQGSPTLQAAYLCLFHLTVKPMPHT